jgi:hypothetical protein
VADVLSGGTSRRPRPRWVVVAGTALAVVVAAVLAVRAAPGRTDAAPAPTPAPAPSAGAAAGTPGVVAVAVGTRWAYALVSDCAGGPAVGNCGYRLHRRSLGGGGWVVLPLVTDRLAGAGAVPILAVSGDEVATVVLSGAGLAYSTAAGGDANPLAPGPPIDAVPADGLADSADCASCRQVTVLEPGTGLLRPLRHQPFRGGRLQSYALRGNALWAVSTTAAGATSAVSTDRGRTWRTLPIRGLAPGTGTLQLVTGPTGPAYLLSATTAGGGSRLVGVWSTQAANGGWERLPGPIPRSARSALVGDRGLLVADAGGTVWRLQPTGGFTALPDPGPTRPELMATGPGRMVAATLRGRIPDRLVLTSFDEGETWRTETI